MAKILIIEDEEVLRDVLKEKLEKAGHEVFTATNGRDGLDIFRKEVPNLVLLDIIMPKMGGFEVMREVFQDKILSAVPIIVISNSGQPVEIEEATRLGAKDFLIKAEFDPQEVIDKVNKYLGGLGTTKPTPSKQDMAVENPGPSGRSAKGARILIVEDDKFLRDLIVQKLTKEGFDVLQAIDGEEGIKLVKENQVDLMLLDLILPGIDGFEVLRQMREDQKTASVPVIILSNLGQKEDVERGLKLGAQDYLIKAHFTPGEIIDKVKAVIQGG